jgi:hypothetical protein
MLWVAMTEPDLSQALEADRLNGYNPSQLLLTRPSLRRSATLRALGQIDASPSLHAEPQLVTQRRRTVGAVRAPAEVDLARSRHRR